MEPMRSVRRAILSASDKEGLAAFAEQLAREGTEILSTGGTAEELRRSGIAVREIADLTGFPEMLGGRVRTLHPLVYGGILARRSLESDREEMGRFGIEPIDLVCVNFYPFEATARREGASEEEILESIDIGGPSLLRAAAKNYAHTAVLFEPAEYDGFLDRLRSPDGVTLADRREMAARAFRRVAAYDEAIEAWFDSRPEERGAVFPTRFLLRGTLRRALRYGENPHQPAAWYGRSSASHRFEALQGKELSYNNLADADAAWRLILEFDDPAAAVIKHGNPCGAAVGEDAASAFRAALAADPVSAFGGVVATNRPVGAAFAGELAPLFLEVVIAPEFEEEARAVLGKKKNLRLVRCTGSPGASALGEVRALLDGFLVQRIDSPVLEEGKWRIVTKRKPTEKEMADARFAWKVAKHVRSNAIVLAKGGAVVGVGAGQMSRVDSTLLAIDKARRAGHETAGSVLASDGFFPFSDSVERAHEAGVEVLVQPGGSIRDDEVFAAADRLGVKMIVTGVRHFRH